MKKRYSELKSFHDTIKKAVGSVTLPNFPPKKWFGNKKSTFVEQRRRNLNDYFERLSKIALVVNTSEFVGFINSRDRVANESRPSPTSNPAPAKQAPRTQPNLDRTWNAIVKATEAKFIYMN
jgi:hypothetical protein